MTVDGAGAVGASSRGLTPINWDACRTNSLHPRTKPSLTPGGQIQGFRAPDLSLSPRVPSPDVRRGTQPAWEVQRPGHHCPYTPYRGGGVSFPCSASSPSLEEVGAANLITARPPHPTTTLPPPASQERGAEYSVSGETIKVPGRTWLRQLPLHKCIYYSSVALNI